MTSVGDVLAVLGLFERIAVELRSYKGAPAHFQNLGAELELIQGTIRQVLNLNPQDGVDRDTLERVRAIALHCEPALRAFAGKMRVRESALGGMRSSKSLISIGKRLHWSMIEAKDVSELRQTVLAEMGAITILLSASQIKSIHHLSKQVAEATTSSALLSRKCEAIGNETSSIARMVARTPDAFTKLHETSKQQHMSSQKQVVALSRGMDKLQASVEELASDTAAESAIVRQFMDVVGNRVSSLYDAIMILKKMISLLATYSAQIVAAVGRNTAMLLDVANQLKVITRAIEAIPLHLTLPVVRLDDALGESWALPFQACTSFDSFYDILRCVVFASHRRGSTKVARNQFSISLTKVGTKLTRSNWEAYARAGMHIEQAVIVSRQSHAAIEAETCPYPGCGGKLLTPDYQNKRAGKECSSCLRWSSTQETASPIMNMGSSRPATEGSPSPSSEPRKRLGPELPPIEMSPDADWSDYRRIEVDIIQTIENEAEARRILKTDPEMAAAHTLLGLLNLREGELSRAKDFVPEVPEDVTNNHIQVAKEHLLAALALPRDHSFSPKSSLQGLSAPRNAEPWYLLGRLQLFQKRHEEAYSCLQQAVYSDGSSTTAWITIGVLYYQVNQYRDSLDAFSRAIRLNHDVPEPWYNLFVLYALCNQVGDAREALEKFYELQTEPAGASHRMSQQVLGEKGPPKDPVDGVPVMLQSKLELRSEEVARGNASLGLGSNFELKPLLRLPKSRTATRGSPSNGNGESNGSDSDDPHDNISGPGQTVDLDALLDLTEYDNVSSIPPPSASPSSSSKPTFASPDTNSSQSTGGPSHNYDIYRQQTGFAPGAIANMAGSEHNVDESGDEYVESDESEYNEYEDGD